MRQYRIAVDRTDLEGWRYVTADSKLGAVVEVASAKKLWRDGKLHTVYIQLRDECWPNGMPMCVQAYEVRGVPSDKPGVSWYFKGRPICETGVDQ
jgi:hypothetical protein